MRVEIIDVRDHIGGNAYSYMDEGDRRGDPQVRRAHLFPRPTRGSGTT